MRILIISSLALFSALTSAADESFVITNAVLISGQEAVPVRNSWIRVRDGLITVVGTGLSDGTDGLRIDADGRYLIPGLIDSHVHLYHATGLKRKYTNDYEELYKDYMAQQPRSFLYYGFTSVVELNADSAANARFLAAPAHPRLFHCGQGVVLSNGFMSLEVPPGQLDQAYPGYLVDHYRTAESPGNTDPERTPSAAVDHVIAAGGRCVKIYYEEAMWWPGGAPAFELPTPQIMKDLVAIAHAHNLPVLLHATTPTGHRFGLEIGVDILAHGIWEWPNQPFDAPEPDTEIWHVAEAIAGSDIWLQPTLSTIRNTGSLFDPDLLDSAGWKHAVPDAYMHYLRNDAQAQRADFLAMFAPVFPEGSTPETLPALQKAFQARYKRLIVNMIDRGANLLFATDTAVGGFGWASPPGLAGFWEIREWANAGVSLADIFAALTVNNAVALRLADEIGTIEPGKRADMLLLRENPLENAEAYDSIELVIVGGKRIARTSLSATRSPAP